MTTPRFPDQHEQTPTRQPLSWRTKAIIAAVVLAVALMIALHVAGVFGP